MRLSLGAKFTIIVLIILVGAMAANALYFLSTASRFHEQQLMERGRALGRLIALISPDAILGFDYLLLNGYTREVSSQPDIVYGAIMNTKGELISSYINESDPMVKSARRTAAPADARELLNRLGRQDDLLQLQFPIIHNNAELGRFSLGISRQSLRAEFQRQMMIQLLVLAGLVLFLSLAIHLVFRANVLAPIKKLVAASEDVGRGQYTLVETRSSDEMGVLAQAFNAMTEEVRREQAKLHRQANFDALTGLPNRMMALDRIKLEVSRAKRSSERFAVFFIDLDNFKHVNDTLGHAVGDELLVAIGARVQTVIRESDIVARLGGDEFVVLAPDIDSDLKAEELAERLIKAVSEPQELAGRKVVANCSIGIALYPDNGATVEELMANADNAMYQAKSTRDGSAIFFTEDMNIRLRERMQMEQDLNLAIASGQLQLEFQPLFNIADQRHLGAEVLLRWQHPERGAISPAVFVPLAETTGQIVAIGDWVLEQACRRWADWQKAGIDPGFLAVNVSRIQFKKRIFAKLTELMARYGVPSHALDLEITESVLLDDHSQMAEELDNLRAAGLKLSLDDFGTGYSSLSYLKRFRFDVLKIDRSFVTGLPNNADDVLLVKAILAMAKGFDIKVVAEGVENQEQLSFLSSLGCDYSQGYLLAKPMNEEAYANFLRNQQSGAQPLRRIAS